VEAVGTTATGPRCKFRKQLAQMQTAAQKEVYWAVNTTANKPVECQVHPSNGDTEATTWSIADMGCVVNLLEREIYGITSIEQMQFKKEMSIHVIQFEPCWYAISIQELWKTNRTVSIPFWISKNPSGEPYIEVNSVNGCWQQLSHRYC